MWLTGKCCWWGHAQLRDLTNILRVYQHTRSGERPFSCRVISHLQGRTIWMYINAYIVKSVHLAVICAINHSNSIMFWGYINAHTVESVHLAVVCANKSFKYHGVLRVHQHTVESVHLAVVCAINHSNTMVFWGYINTHIVETVHIAAICHVIHTANWSDGTVVHT